MLIEAGLVDELLFWVHPAIGGAGTRPYEGMTGGLKLLGSASYDPGVTLLRYQPQVG